MNWLVVKSNKGKVEFKDNSMFFAAAPKTTSGQEEDSLVRLQTDKYFETGIIKFNLNFLDDISQVFTINLGQGDVLFGANSKYSKSGVFSIRTARHGDGVSVLDENVDKQSLRKNHDYRIQFEVNGSNLHLYVDEVLVCQSYGSIKNNQVQVSVYPKSKIEIKDFEILPTKPKAFVVMQFTDDFNELYTEVIKPVCESYGYECKRGDDYFTNGSILQDIIQSIKESSVIIADITPNNPNVFYELGYAHAIGKQTILLSDKKRDKLPFDVSGFRTLFYDNTIAGKSAVEKKLIEHLKSIK